MRVPGGGQKTTCHLQGPELGHVVETGHGQTADVVVVEGAEEDEEQTEPLDQSGFMGQQNGLLLEPPRWVQNM